MSIITTVIKCVLFIVIRIMERKWVYYPFRPLFTIDTMLNFNSGHNGHGLKTLCVNRPLVI